MNFILDKDGKPVFTGKEDPANPPVKPSGEGSKIECPVCHGMFDYILGFTKKGCEGCFDKSKDVPEKGGDTYDREKEIE